MRTLKQVIAAHGFDRVRVSVGAVRYEDSSMNADRIRMSESIPFEIDLETMEVSKLVRLAPSVYKRADQFFYAKSAIFIELSNGTETAVYSFTFDFERVSLTNMTWTHFSIKREISKTEWFVSFLPGRGLVTVQNKTEHATQKTMVSINQGTYEDFRAAAARVSKMAVLA